MSKRARLPFFYAAQPIFPSAFSTIWNCFLSSEAAFVVAAATFAITFSLTLKYCTTFDANRNIRFILLYPTYNGKPR